MAGGGSFGKFRPCPTHVLFSYTNTMQSENPQVVLCQWCFREFPPDQFKKVRDWFYGNCCVECLKKRDRGELARDRAAYELGLVYAGKRYQNIHTALRAEFSDLGLVDQSEVDELAVKLVLETKRLSRLREFMGMLDMGSDPETAEVPEE